MKLVQRRLYLFAETGWAGLLAGCCVVCRFVAACTTYFTRAVGVNQAGSWP